MNPKDFSPDALIFDVDGVLINVEKSFPEVIRRSVLEGWKKFCGGTVDAPGYTKEHERILKRHGAFNDDFDIVWVLLAIARTGDSVRLSEAFPSPERLAREVRTLSGPVPSWVLARYGSEFSRHEIRQMCADHYMNELHKLETPMLRCHWSKLPLPVAIYTGRSGAEWLLAKRLLGWEDFPDELVIHSDSGVLKPSPHGLTLLCERLGAARPVFFGDTASDLMAGRAFGKGYFIAIGDLLPDARYIYANTESALESLLNFKMGDISQ